MLLGSDSVFTDCCLCVNKNNYSYPFIIWMNIKIPRSSREKQNLRRSCFEGRLCLICFPPLPLGFKLPPFEGPFQPTVAGSFQREWIFGWIGWRWRRGGWAGGRLARGEENKEDGRGQVRGVRMSVIALQWEVVLKIPIDTWAPTHKQGHRQTHKAVTKEVLFMHHQRDKLCTNILDLLGPQTCPHTSATRKNENHDYSF